MSLSVLKERGKCTGDFWDNGMRTLFSLFPAKYNLHPEHITQAQEGSERPARRNPGLETWDPGMAQWRGLGYSP